MSKLPRISVVTPSYNQGQFIAATIDSVLAQDYPDFEHIIVDGMSTDETPVVLGRYPHLHVIREPDRGQAVAINKGFHRATGQIFCFLNSDDTFLPGAFHCVAGAIDPERGRHIVTGRCIYIGADGRPTGREHPCAYRDHLRVLEAWKVHCLPQPSTFWTADVWRRCGPLDEREPLVLDYDLFCRFSRDYHFYIIDQVLAAYRLHPDSKTCSHGPREAYHRSLRISRRYWGPPGSPLYRQLLWSLVGHRLARAAGRLTATGATLWLDGRWAQAAVCVFCGALLSPGAALRRFVRRHAPVSADGRVPVDPESLTWRGFNGVHEDGCLGPTLRLPLVIQPGDRWLALEGGPFFRYHSPALEIALSVDGRSAGRFKVDPRRTFSVCADLGRLTPGNHDLEVVARPIVIPDDYLGNRDARPLTFRLHRIQLFPQAKPSADSDRAILFEPVLSPENCFPEGCDASGD